jgi:hypothetical protein
MRTLRSLLLYLLLGTALVALIGAPAAHGQGATPATKPPPGEYLFVEIWTAVSGTGKLPRLCIDFPGYTFDRSSGALAPFFADTLPPLLPSEWGFSGRGMSRSGAAGCGTASSLEPIASLPYTTTVGIGTGTAGEYGEQLRSAEVYLIAIAADGQLTANIEGESVTLAPGQRWSKVVGADFKNDAFDGYYEITSSVTNYGWNDRARIKGPTHFIWLPLMSE